MVLITARIGHFCCQEMVSKRIGVTKSNVFSVFVMTLLASRHVLQKRNNF